MLARTLKTTALAAAVVIATAGASMAATWAWVDQDSKVRANHHLASPTVNWVEDGQKVQVIAKWNNWYKLKIPGPDGWVRRTVLDFDPPYKPGKPGFGSSFCLNGDNAQFCLGFSN
ncbi:MAG: SH3 domain-containing protein [Devosia sp.]|nr:SH3 domain-containing protein [Devosia sp.]